MPPPPGTDRYDELDADALVSLCGPDEEPSEPAEPEFDPPDSDTVGDEPSPDARSPGPPNADEEGAGGSGARLEDASAAGCEEEAAGWAVVAAASLRMEGAAANMSLRDDVEEGASVEPADDDVLDLDGALPLGWCAALALAFTTGLAATASF